MQYETIYIPENEFVMYIKSFGIGYKAQLIVVDGKNRWLVEQEDGKKVIVRPEIKHE